MGIDDSKPAVRAMTKAQAEEVTARIREGIAETWRLIVEAFDGKAWVPLGYSSFKGYLADEFGMSESNGYRLLNQGRIIRELESASGTDLSGVVSGRAADELADVIEEATAAVAPVAKMPATSRKAAAANALKEVRSRAAGTPARGSTKLVETTAQEIPNADLLVGVESLEAPPTRSSSTAKVIGPRTSPSAATPPDATIQSREDQVHGIFDRFFSADPVKLAAMSDLKEGKGRVAMARRWVDRYEMAVKGVAPYTPGPANGDVTPNWKGAKK